MTKTFADRALPMLAKGWMVIPLTPREKEPYLLGWTGWLMPTPEEIEAWSAANPDDNCGVVASPDTFVGLDVDDPAWVTEIEAATGQTLPRTYAVRSGRLHAVGMHYYYTATDLSRQLMRNGVIKGKGQWQVRNKYLVGPGSVHPSGQEYQVHDDHAPQPIPDWLVHYLVGLQEPEAPRRVSAFQNVGTADEQRIFVDDYLAANPWETRGVWLDYVAPGGQRGYKRHVRCINDAQHDKTYGDKASATSILVADGMGLDYKCQHGHCAQLAWEDFQRATQKLPDLTAWRKQPLTVGAWGSADVTEGASATALVTEGMSLATAASPALVTEGMSLATATTAAIITSSKTEDEEIPFPMDVLDCRIGRIAKTLQAPAAWGFFSTLTCYAAQGVAFETTLPTNLYNALLGGPGRGKSLTADHALRTFIYEDGDEHTGVDVITDALCSDNDVVMTLGHKVKDLTDRDRVPRRVLLYQDEGSALLSKTAIDRATLAQALNQLFYRQEFGKKVGPVKWRCYARLCLLMGLTVRTPTDFAELFGRTTRDGFYDRFLFADGPRRWKVNPRWRPDPVILRPSSLIALPEKAEALRQAWMEVDYEGRQRLGEMALRIAVVLTSAEQLPPDCQALPYVNLPGVKAMPTPAVGVTSDAMQLALRVMDYQIAVRKVYAPGVAEDTLDAKCQQAIQRQLEGNPPKGWRGVYRSANLQRFGEPVVNRVLRELERSGLIEFLEETLANGRVKKFVRWVD